MAVAETRTLDVFRNLALEEALLESEGPPTLMLWRSAAAVVIGKNQNPWRECRLGRMAAEGVALARRISGGGAVYHDAGNLNYAVVTDRRTYDESRTFGMVLRALERLGVRAERMGKSSLAVAGRKVSGNAFCFRAGRVLHHGTLLLDADLERLGRYLGPTFEGIETGAVASVPAATANLGLPEAAVRAALAESFLETFAPGAAPERREEGDFDAAFVDLALRRLESEAWLYARTPRFSVSAGDRRMKVKKGIVVEDDAGEFVGQSFLRAAARLGLRAPPAR